MGALSLPPTRMIVHHIFRSPPSPSPFSFFIIRPLQEAPSRSTPSLFLTAPLSSRSVPLSHYLSSSKPAPIAHSFTDSQTLLEDPIATLESYNGEDDDDFAAGDEIGSENGDAEFTSLKTALDDSLSNAKNDSVSKLPVLTVKERKELSSYAHSLGKKLKSQQVGKSGVTESVVTALIETLEANELLKLKIHGTCPGELEDVVKKLEVATGSVMVSKIGRTVILYSPSLSKLKAEERKKQAQSGAMKKQSASKPLFEDKFKSREQAKRLLGGHRRGTGRF